MNHKTIVVLRGGPSEEYSVSMETGSNVLKALIELGYTPRDIVVTKKGEWLEDGFIKNPETCLDYVDAVFLALHGVYGEDGQVQRILERKRIPFTGSKALPSSIAFNKELTKQTLKPHGVMMPRHRKVTLQEIGNLEREIPLIFSEIGNELFVKPVTNGSSIGAAYVPDNNSLFKVLSELLPRYENVMVEEYIRGREASIAVLDNFRNESVYALPAIEIIPPTEDEFFSHENKYNGMTEEIVPGRFSYGEKERLAEVALLVHKIIDCKQYSRSDFIVNDGDVYFLEVNTLPGLTSESLFPKAAASVGLEYNQLIKHLVDSVLL